MTDTANRNTKPTASPVQMVAATMSDVAWLASPENKDGDTRENAKAVLDKMYYLLTVAACADDGHGRKRQTSSPHGGAWPKKPKPPRIETAPDLQAASGDADTRG